MYLRRSLGIYTTHWTPRLYNTAPAWPPPPWSSGSSAGVAEPRPIACYGTVAAYRPPSDSWTACPVWHRACLVRTFFYNYKFMLISEKITKYKFLLMDSMPCMASHMFAIDVCLSVYSNKKTWHRYKTKKKYFFTNFQINILCGHFVF